MSRIHLAHGLILLNRIVEMKITMRYKQSVSVESLGKMARWFPAPNAMGSE